VTLGEARGLGVRICRVGCIVCEERLRKKKRVCVVSVNQNESIRISGIGRVE
jgi:hypothetical protein